MQKEELLTREKLIQRINNFINHHNGYSYLFAQYFIQGVSLRNPKDLDTKTKFYFYLMKCAQDYRVFVGREEVGPFDSLKQFRNTNELLELLAFLEDHRKYGNGKKKTTNKEWLASKLVDKQEKKEDELWGSGEHEWLLRSLIVEVIKRSAGMYPDIQSHIDEYCVEPSYDWIKLQFELRTKTKYIFFKNEDETIESGHCGAVKLDPKKSGFVTVGSPEFHDKLVQAFNASTTIDGFLTRVANVVKAKMISGGKPIIASPRAKFLVDATLTDDEAALEKFRKNKLYPDGYVATRNLIATTQMLTTHFGCIERKNSAEEISSDSDDELPELTEGVYRIWKGL